MYNTMTEFKSRKLMEDLGAAMAASEGLQRETAKKIGGTVVITVVKKKGGEDKEVWVLEAKDGKASLRKGDGGGVKDAVVKIGTDDASLVRLVKGKVSAQALFLRGKLSLGGDLGKARHVEALLATKAKL